MSSEPTERDPPLPVRYLVCGAPRTGSTLLCHSLWLSGRAGRPDEYFDPAILRERGWADFP